MHDDETPSRSGRVGVVAVVLAALALALALPAGWALASDGSNGGKAPAAPTAAPTPTEVQDNTPAQDITPAHDITPDRDGDGRDCPNHDGNGHGGSQGSSGTQGSPDATQQSTPAPAGGGNDQL
jgi:hypothetical protein